MEKFPAWLNESKLRTQVSNEWNLSFSTVTKRRQIYRDQDALYNGSGDTDKLDLKTLFYNVQSRAASSYTDRKKVKFTPRTVGGDWQARNLEKLADFDYDEMNKAFLDFEGTMNRLLRGVRVDAYAGWDSVRKVPIVKTIDTRNWYPDPNGWWSADKFRFHGFDTSATMEEISYNPDYFNVNELKETIQALQKEGSQEKTNRSYAQRARGLNPAEQGVVQDPLVHLYFHYTTYWDESNNPHRMMSVWGADRQVLLYVEEFEAVYPDEKENPMLVPFPVNLTYFLPDAYNPFGISLADLVQAPHRFKNVLANLMFIKEKDQALGDDFLFDTNVIKNPNDLTKPSITRKGIGADGRKGSLQGAVAIIPKNPASPSNYNFIDLLDKVTAFATGQDARQMGIEGSSDITLGEAQQIQANANLLTQYLSNIEQVGERGFWKLWMRSYRQNFGKSEKKLVRVTDTFGSKNVFFTKKDIISDNDPDVKISSASDEEAKNVQARVNLAPVLMQVVANPSYSSFSRNSAMRKLLTINGLSEEEAEVYAPQSYEEVDALQKLELINNNDPLGAKIDPETIGNVDHNVYLQIFKRALDNPVKFAAIQARKEAIIKTGQNQMRQPQAPSLNPMANMASSSMMANANSVNAAHENNLVVRSNPNQ